MISHRMRFLWLFDLRDIRARSWTWKYCCSTRNFAITNLQLMSIQNNTLGGRLDVDKDLYDPLEAESTTEFKIKELDIIIDRLDTDTINKGLLQ